ncbi:hypothetical protein NQ176_g10594 [Zarea fungicola]|uniref:Uncharacterized protein n=1 Tax=Zarea fungicola TaxID=93591 RepID=A0ACC1MFB6_9HYPO|nr:hypothetical protein NQ176_g10594 [Lecanicillium fungicola]
MASEKFANPPQRPPLFNYTPSQIAAAAEEVEASLRSAIDKVVASTTPENATFANTLQPILDNDSAILGMNQRICFMQNVHKDAALREASVKADGKLRELDVELKMRDDIFQRVNTVFRNRESANLDTESARILEKEHKSYEIQLEISRKSLEVQNNNNNEVGGSWFTPEQLEGIPKTDIDIDALEKGTGENEGKVKVNYKYTSSVPLGKYAKNATTRRDYAIDESNKVNENVPLFQSLIELRDEAARIAGYKNHADLIISAKMAKDVDKVKAFLADLRSRVEDGGKQEVNRLLELKKKDYAERGQEFDGEIYSWDIAFYSRLLKENEYSINESEVAEYFPTWHTFRGMLGIFEKLFGLKFRHPLA